MVYGWWSGNFYLLRGDALPKFTNSFWKQPPSNDWSMWDIQRSNLFSLIQVHLQGQTISQALLGSAEGFVATASQFNIPLCFFCFSPPLHKYNFQEYIPVILKNGNSVPQSLFPREGDRRLFLL